MARPSYWQEVSRRGPDLVTRIVRIALVIYLAPALIATLAVGIVALALFHLAILTSSVFHHHRTTVHRPTAVMSSRIGGGRSGAPPLV
ncbi:hypothetical protein TA3x_005144 [Tundrisphaera sp. TA3]|uniref:hypothetical protein n=1 Tax=Tundrisphaera sp. TA3 TaxID=3435775 RepID=UPI003EB69FC8